MTVKTPVYMDYHATTPVDPRVLEVMMPYFTENFGNASSTDHIYGAKAAESVEKSREQIASLINARPEEIVFTSGATESDNLAIKGVAFAYKEKGKHIVTCATEHKAVLNTCKYLEELGWSITYLPVDRFGVVDLDRLEKAITDKTVLISIMFANNEIGTIAPIEKIGQIAKRKGIFFHTDAAQAVGHIPVDVDAMNIDLMSISSHKAYGPKGAGVLFLRRHGGRVKALPLIHGGGQERGVRSGTENVPGVVGMGKALEIAAKEMRREADRLFQWTEKMRETFLKEIGAEQNGHPIRRLPHNLNIFFKGVESKALIQLLGRDLAISAGSACTTREVEPSHVITALGFPPERAYSSIRFGLGRFNTEEEVDYAIQAVERAVLRLRKIVA
jgi:cysteine desulfurase